ncbi:hypothetical protein HK096_006956 [Nowakowskiella sp. JEL0078]|nr:hypothetical protein HK096_006956 [Nowakowskiella sp. JEL0078]
MTDAQTVPSSPVPEIIDMEIVDENTEKQKDPMVVDEDEKMIRSTTPTITVESPIETTSITMIVKNDEQDILAPKEIFESESEVIMSDIKNPSEIKDDKSLLETPFNHANVSITSGLSAGFLDLGRKIEYAESTKSGVSRANTLGTVTVGNDSFMSRKSLDSKKLTYSTSGGSSRRVLSIFRKKRGKSSTTDMITEEEPQQEEKPARPLSTIISRTSESNSLNRPITPSESNSISPSRISINSDFYNNAGTDGMPRMPKLKYHAGPLDRRALTSKPPGVLITEIQHILEDMGMDVTRDDESEFRLTVVRPRWNPHDEDSHAHSVSAPINEIDETSVSTNVENRGNGILGLLNNRRISVADENIHATQTVRPSVDSRRSRSTSRKPSGKRPKIAVILASLPQSFVKRITHMARYGRSWNKGYDGTEPEFIGIPGLESPSEETSRQRNSFAWTRHNQPKITTMYEDDRGAEVRYVVEIHKIRNLSGLFVVDFKRTKGDIWAFKRIYQEALPKLPVGDFII